MPIIYSYHKDLDVEGYQDAYPTLRKAKIIHNVLSKREGVTLLEPTPLTRADYQLAHTAKYLDDLDNKKTTNGFGNYDYNILKQARRAAGCTVAAAKYAFEHKANTFALTSGAHHAREDKANGYCTINNIVIAAILSGATRVLIIDADQHEGDGIIQIVNKRKLHSLIDYHHARTPKEIAAIDTTGVDLIIFNDGQDAAFDDCGSVSEKELIQRVLVVRGLDIPTVTCLAGGYNDIPTIVDRHLRTISLLER